MADDTKQRTVKVRCAIPNGIELRVFKEGHDDGSGTRRMVVDTAHPPIVLAGPGAIAAGTLAPEGLGETEVPADLWDLWLKQNQNSPLVTSGQVTGPDQKAATDERV